ncbi:MAG TPA: N-acetylmuramoyl-L-alanine amidase [Pseudolabrys sp.]|nr:N-acetylmuramoyl-L-alanine amidase [Pseudolabrys sp.]
MTLRALILAAALGMVPVGGLVPVSAALAAEGAAAVPSVTAVRVGGDDKQTRFVLDIDRQVELATFTLADPYRVVVDLPQVAFQLPDKAGDHGRGLIKSFRYGLIMQGGSRIVMDTKGPVKVEKAFVMASTEGQPARLVIDLTATDRDAYLRNIALENRPAKAPKQPAVAVKPDGDPRPLIVLDPGHGGIDTGTHGLDGELEKDVVLSFASEVRTRLEASGKYRVLMTRGDDTFIPLNDRVRFARSHGAALFVSIHADALPKKEGQADGATVYTLSEHASDAEAARLADDENKADVIAGVDLSAEPDDVANILVDLAQRETKTFSLQFAHATVKEFKTVARLHKRPLKSAGFVVLKAPDVPSVLIELGYMSNRGDLNHLVDAEWRGKTAAALAHAVDDFFAPRLAGAAAMGQRR